MPDERLLERIGILESNPDFRVERDVSREVQSIINHLQRILNTRQGCVLIADDYGIPDITNSPGENFTETTKRIEVIIHDVIMKYEPRLTGVIVEFFSEKDDVLTLRFKLKAILVQDKKTPVTFETVVSSEGRVNVRE